MLKKYLKFNIIFTIIFVLQLIAVFNQISALLYITKPLIVLSLLIMLYYSTKLTGRFHKRMFTGLIFALAGDVLLMLVQYNDNYFIYGLIAFLLCHLFYIRAFYLDFSSAPQLDKKGARVAILVCAVLCFGFYLYLRPYLGVMRMPVMIYTFVISLMLMMAAFRNMRVNKQSFNLVLYGAIFFLLSDSALAYNKFVQALDHGGMLIMATYMIAQYLITIGAIERKLLNTD